MSKSTYRQPQTTRKSGPTPLVRGTAILLSLLVIASIVANLVR